MIQGGDPLTKDPEPKRAPGAPGDPAIKVKAEFNDRHHDRGVLSMARSQDPIQQAASSLSAMAPRGFWTINHRVGKLIKGDDVLEKMPADADASAGPAETNGWGSRSIKIVAGDFSE